jgi:ferredoxin
MLNLLEKITRGEGELADLDKLEDLCNVVRDASLCGLGQTAPNPVLTTLRFFRGEYEAHIRDKKCPAGVCKPLITYRVVDEKCPACGACKRVCPVEAITGAKKVIHKILVDKCIKCGACYESCKFDAIVKE